MNITQEKELIEEAKKLWQESHPNPIEMALFGAKWMKSRMSFLIKKEQERMYSEEEVLELLSKRGFDLKHKKDSKTTSEWFEQFKKKTQ